MSPHPNACPSLSRRLLGFFSVLTLAATLPLAGCGVTRPYYAGFHLDAPPLQESDRSEMVVYLDAMIRSEKLKKVTFALPGGPVQSLYPHDETSPPTIDWLPLPVLFATRFILNPKLKGLEIDLYVRTEADGYTPVTALQELDGRVHIQMGPARKSLVPEGGAATAAVLQARFGIGPLSELDRTWQPLELHGLEQALGLLSPTELAAISGVPFVRKGQAEGAVKKLPPDKVWGQYSADSTEEPPRRIFLYDTKAGHADSLFIGDPDRAYPIVTMCLLHEIGHAFADLARVQVYRTHNQQISAHNQLVERWNSLLAADHLQGPERDELQRKLEQIRVESAGFDPRFKQTKREYERNYGPVHATFRSVRGSEGGPTEYGHTDIEESFAESFALYKADPAALRRIYPQVYDWFQGGGHVQALRAALGPDAGLLDRSATAVVQSAVGSEPSAPAAPLDQRK